MSDAWKPITIREVCVVTAAAAGGIFARGEAFGYLVCDASDAFLGIAVRTVDDLREMLPTLRPERITYRCAEHEQEAMRTLVQQLERSSSILKMILPYEN